MTIFDINKNGYILTQEQRDNLEKLAIAVSTIEMAMNRIFIVTSGLRTPQDQARINPTVTHSAHMTGEAVDVADLNGGIYEFCLDSVEMLIRLGLYLEDKRWTKSWVHFTTRAPLSGRRFFIP